MKPEKFINTADFYEEEFFRVCRYIIWTYNKLLTDKIYFPKNQETFLRNVLIKKYLRKYKIEHGLEYLGFEVESGEINVQGKIIGFIDIKILNIGKQDFLNEDEYYAIECKRLDGTNNLNREYVNEGILRFVISKYSSQMPMAAMIGFVEKNSIPDIIEDINLILDSNTKINTIQNLTFFNLNIFFKYFYHSIHGRETGIINLYHFMLDYKEVIKAKTKKVS